MSGGTISAAMSPIGTSRHFAASQQLGRLRSEADILVIVEYAHLCFLQRGRRSSLQYYSNATANEFICVHATLAMSLYRRSWRGRVSQYVATSSWNALFMAICRHRFVRFCEGHHP